MCAKKADLERERAVVLVKGREEVPVADWWHQIVLAAEPLSAGLARDFVCLHLVVHHLPHLVEDVRLVVSELATNALAHAQTPFVVTLSSANGSLLLDIQDESASAPVRSAPDVMDMSGRGLMIVELLSQEWGTSTGAHGFKSVWASFPERPWTAVTGPVSRPSE